MKSIQRAGYHHKFVVELKKPEKKMLDSLCKIHNRSINKEIEIMIRFYYKNHRRVEEYLT